MLLVLAAGGAPAAAASQIRFPDEPECPEGASIAGAPPPAGRERYCRKMGPTGAEIRHGAFRAWYSNGQAAAEGEYRDGLREGPWRRWWDNGQPFERIAFRAGKVEGAYRSWYRAGQASASGTYRSDWPDGPWLWWHESGKPAARGSYDDGLQAGDWHYWREDGAFLASGSYVTGLMDPLAVPVPGNLPGGEAKAARVLVDPRIELISAALSLTNWPNLGPWNTGETRYAREVAEHFRPHRDHAAIRLLDAMVGAGFTFDVPLRWIAHYGDLPALAQEAPFEPYMLRRASAQEMRDLAAALRDLARRSDFLRFFAAHRRDYERLTDEYREEAAPHLGLPGELERYFGERRRAYSIVIAPQLGGRSYGFWFGEGDGAQVYAVGPPDRVAGGDPGFDRRAISSTLFREFNRSFVEGAIQDAYREDLRPDLFRLVKPDMDDLGFPTWRWALVEMAVRACEIRLLQNAGRRDEARERLREGVQGERFLWLPYAVERLSEYERQRDRYPTFRAFAPRFLESLDAADPLVIGGRPMFLIRRKV
ncbi:MAG: DUF4932 domain-containing protein [Candidatus Sericytochromatia bacterium]|nr:DUF4932 domain-containing protein [Candidatus Tanganyikabacteria bacterium]